jgi:hypothetical protein
VSGAGIVLSDLRLCRSIGSQLQKRQTANFLGQRLRKKTLDLYKE